MTTTWYFGVVGEESELCGEEFFVEVETDTVAAGKSEAWRVARENFPDEELDCYGRISEEAAEMMGLDTY